VRRQSGAPDRVAGSGLLTRWPGSGGAIFYPHRGDGALVEVGSYPKRRRVRANRMTAATGTHRRSSEAQGPMIAAAPQRVGCRHRRKVLRTSLN